MSDTLPPDPEGANDDRAERAGSCIRHFQCITGIDYEDTLGSLLTDLIHWADRSNFNFELAIDRARHAYLCETVGERYASR